MIEVIKEILLNVGIPAITGFSGFLYARKKNNSDLQNDELDQVVKSLGIYRGMVEDLSIKMEALNKKYDTLELEFIECKKKLLP